MGRPRIPNRADDGLPDAAQHQRPGCADLQAIDLRDGLHLAHGLTQHVGHLGAPRRDLLQQAGHAPAGCS